MNIELAFATKPFKPLFGADGQDVNRLQLKKIDPIVSFKISFRLVLSFKNRFMLSFVFVFLFFSVCIMKSESYWSKIVKLVTKLLFVQFLGPTFDSLTSIQFAWVTPQYPAVKRLSMRSTLNFRSLLHTSFLDKMKPNDSGRGLGVFK